MPAYKPAVVKTNLAWADLHWHTRAVLERGDLRRRAVKNTKAQFELMRQKRKK